MVLTAIATTILGGAVWFVYGRSLSAPLIYDDSNSVLYNPSILHLWPLVGDADHPGPLNPGPESSTSGRPLVNLSLAVNYHFGGLNVAGYHLFNIAVHTVVALLVWSTLARVLRLSYFGGSFDQQAEPLALLIALMWAVHPLQTETVTYITQRTELLMGAFYVATLYGSLRYWAATTPLGRRTWLSISIISCIAGMTCKEVMVSAPVVVLLFERTFLTGSFRRALAASWPLYAGFLLGWVVLLALNVNGPRAATAGFHAGVPAVAWWLTQCKVLLMYLGLAVWPWPLVIHYEMAYFDTFSAAWPWLGAVAALVVATLTLNWRPTAVGFLFASILMILAPTSLVPIATEVAAERRMYLPLVAILVLAIMVGYRLLQRLVGRRRQDETGTIDRPTPLLITTGACVLLAVGYMTVDVHRLSAYQNAVTLWQDTATHLPDSPLVLMNLGLELVNAGRPQEAIEQYEHLLRLEPDKRAPHLNNMGCILLRAGRIPEAMTRFEEALQEQPDFVEAHNNLGMALVDAGRPQDAIPHFQATLRLKPEYAAGHINLGTALAAVGRREEAIEQFQQTLAREPDSIDAQMYLARTYADLRRVDEASAAAEQALMLARLKGRNEYAAQIHAWLTALRASRPPN
ncbi:MAG TPA: tetratricopeptide repeat protein [Pirellulales bacterium]